MPTEAQQLSAARPEVTISSRRLPSLTDALTSMRVHEGRECPATLELEFGNWGTPPAGGTPDFRYLDRREIDFGMTIAIALGTTRLFAGRITALEAVFDPGESPRLIVLAEDALQQLRLTRRTRTFERVTVADLARSIGGDHGLRTDIDLPGPTHERIAQLDQSDLAFLRDRVRAAGGELWVTDSTLHVRKRSARDQGKSALLRLNSELRELRVRADLAHQATAVIVAGWDVAGKAPILDRADELGPEAGDGDSGAALLQRAFGDRVQTVAAASPLTSADAREHAAALFAARSRRFVRGFGVCDASADLWVGRKVTLEGVGLPFSGDGYVVVECAHRFDARAGARTEFTVERPVLRTS